MESFAERGWRTLVFAYKKLNQYNDAAADSFYESDMILLGASGVEDLLQDGVKKCITDF